MARIDLLVSDVDRTLLTHTYVLPQTVVRAFGDLRASGVKIVLASARSPEALRPYAERLGLTELAVCFNGGWIGNLETGKTIEDVRIDRSQALGVMRAAKQLSLSALWYGEGGVFSVGHDLVAANEVTVTGERLTTVETVDDLPGEPGKIMYVRNRPQDLDGFEGIRAKFWSTLSVVSSHWRLLEVGPKEVSKRTAIEALCRRLGIEQSACAAAGDAENDLEMLGWASVKLTVANAIEQIRELADFVGPSCDEGGMSVAANWLNARRSQPTEKRLGGTRNG